uniref:Uncharacterized protein n=1 Tax=Ditylenchus dipsaci TaxID=166011 RepID=A0A915DEA5_9BILA
MQWLFAMCWISKAFSYFVLPIFEQLLATLEKDKKEIHPLALEISALLDEVGKQSGPHSLLVCKRDFRDVINSWEECLANEIYINNTQVADPEKSIQENTFG